MKKTIITLLTILILSSTLLAENKTPNQYLDKHIFIETMDNEYIYQGTCIEIKDTYITIRYIGGQGVKILTIPMHRVRRFYILEEEK